MSFENIKTLASQLNPDLQRELNGYIGISDMDRMKKSMVMHQLKQKFINSDILVFAIYRRQSKKVKKYLRQLPVFKVHTITCFQIFSFLEVQDESYEFYVLDILLSRPMNQHIRLRSIKPSFVTFWEKV